MSGADYDPFGDRISVVQEPPDAPMWLQQSTPEFANGYQRGWHAAQVTRAPLATWRGSCGHLWDRSVEDTDECPRCAPSTVDAERASRPSEGEAALRERVVAAAVEWESAHDALTFGAIAGDADENALLERYSEACVELLAVVSQNRAALVTPVPADDREPDPLGLGRAVADYERSIKDRP